MTRSAEPRFIDLLSPSVQERCRIRRFAAGEVIVREGEAGCEASILLSGRCDVTVHGETLNLIHPGELSARSRAWKPGLEPRPYVPQWKARYSSSR